MPLEKLSKPPVVEVVCGFVFPPLAELDPILIGTYWNTRRNEYPKRQVQPALTSAANPIQVEGLGPMRSWLISADDEFLVQIQPDH